ncbi:MAG: hypothetical protein Q4G09_08195 [Clostridia bacterium]|nr:hypothetical protein [Clostridia bacterium]
MKDIDKQEKKIREKLEEAIREIKESEEKRLDTEIKRKKLSEEEIKLQELFSNRIGTNLEDSKKIVTFIKRYILIGIITGIPGIALTYLYDKWEENKIVKDLYSKNIQTILQPNNRELAKEYELLKNKFYKAYDIDKIEMLLKTSEELEKLKNDKQAIEKLNIEIKKCMEVYEQNIEKCLETQIIEQTTTVETEEEEELEMEEIKRPN